MIHTTNVGALPEFFMSLPTFAVWSNRGTTRMTPLCRKAVYTERNRQNRDRLPAQSSLRNTPVMMISAPPAINRTGHQSRQRRVMIPMFRRVIATPAMISAPPIA